VVIDWYIGRIVHDSVPGCRSHPRSTERSFDELGFGALRSDAEDMDSPKKQGTKSERQQARTLGRFLNQTKQPPVRCPSCGLEVAHSKINAHLDQCVTVSQPPQEPPPSPPPAPSLHPLEVTPPRPPAPASPTSKRARAVPATPKSRLRLAKVRRLLNLTQRALSVTQRALNVTQRPTRPHTPADSRSAALWCRCTAASELARRTPQRHGTRRGSTRWSRNLRRRGASEGTARARRWWRGSTPPCAASSRTHEALRSAAYAAFFRTHEALRSAACAASSRTHEARRSAACARCAPTPRAASRPPRARPAARGCGTGGVSLP
jgi:hypothetical protein